MLTQLLVNGLINGCVYALVAIGFGLIYNTTRIFHFAHGALYTVSAYLFYTFLSLLHIPLPLAVAIALFCSVGLGIGADEAVYKPLLKRGSSGLILLLSSIGLYIVLVNIIAMLYGNETKVLSPGIQPTYSIGSVILTRLQLITALTFIVLFTAFFLVLRRTSLGKLLRATRDDPELLAVMGISPTYIRRVVFGLGTSFAAVPAILLGLDVGIDPNIGMSALLNGAVAVIAGGVGVFEGAALGALLLGFLQSFVIWKTSARWVDAATFALLILFLVLRPQGILGKRQRVEGFTK